MGRAQLAARSGAVNVALTVTALVATAAGLLLKVQTANYGRPFDVASAVVIWSYLVGTPFLTAFTLIAGDRRRPLIKASYLLLVLWLIALGTTASMTM